MTKSRMVLAYCVTGVGVAQPKSAAAGGKLVESVQVGGLLCWYSEIAGAPAVSDANAAVLFFYLVDELFQAETVVPFRYPTVMNSVEELRRVVAENEQQFAKLLKRVEGKAEVR